MRHLTVGIAESALRRGRSIEQFLGQTVHNQRRGIAWVEITPVQPGYAIAVFTRQDSGGEDACDLAEFMLLDSDDEDAEFGRLVATAPQVPGALALASELTGARIDRWVNEAMAGEEYLDYVLAGRPAVWPPSPA